MILGLVLAISKLLWIQNDLITRHYEGLRLAAESPDLVSGGD